MNLFEDLQKQGQVPLKDLLLIFMELISAGNKIRHDSDYDVFILYKKKREYIIKRKHQKYPKDQSKIQDVLSIESEDLDEVYEEIYNFLINLSAQERQEFYLKNIKSVRMKKLLNFDINK
jgi:hypothetical protein